MKMSFYTPEITNVPAGKPVMDRMVQQNHLPGRYVIHSFQEVKSVDRTGADQRGWYYHVGITEDIKISSCKGTVRYVFSSNEFLFPLQEKEQLRVTQNHPELNARRKRRSQKSMS